MSGRPEDHRHGRGDGGDEVGYGITEEPEIDLYDSTPVPPDEPGSGIGVSSEWVGHAGPGQSSTVGTHWTGPVPHPDPAQEPPEQRPGHREFNPPGPAPLAARPTLDPHPTGSDQTDAQRVRHRKPDPMHPDLRHSDVPPGEEPAAR